MTVNPNLNRVKQSSQARREEVFCFQELLLCGNGIAERPKGRYSASIDHVQVAFLGIFYVGWVGYAEYLQYTSRHFLGVRSLQTLFHLAVSSFDKEKFLPWLVFSYSCQSMGENDFTYFRRNCFFNFRSSESFAAWIRRSSSSIASS